MNICRHTVHIGLEEERNTEAANDVVNHHQSVAVVISHQQAVEEESFVHQNFKVSCCVTESSSVDDL